MYDKLDNELDDELDGKWIWRVARFRISHSNKRKSPGWVSLWCISSCFVVFRRVSAYFAMFRCVSPSFGCLHGPVLQDRSQTSRIWFWFWSWSGRLCSWSWACYAGLGLVWVKRSCWQHFLDFVFCSN